MVPDRRDLSWTEMNTVWWEQGRTLKTTEERPSMMEADGHGQTWTLLASVMLWPQSRGQTSIVLDNVWLWYRLRLGRPRTILETIWWSTHNIHIWFQQNSFSILFKLADKEIRFPEVYISSYAHRAEEHYVFSTTDSYDSSHNWQWRRPWRE